MLPDLLAGLPLPSVEIEALFAASAQVRSLCGWHIAPEVTEQVRLPWNRSGRYLLPSLHVSSVNSVTAGGSSIAFDWSAAGEVLIYPYGSGYGYGLRTVVIDFTHGYAECPADVQQAVVTRASRIASGRVQTQSAGPFSMTTAFESDPDSDLASYRLPSIA